MALSASSHCASAACEFVAVTTSVTVMHCDKETLLLDNEVGHVSLKSLHNLHVVWVLYALQIVP
jgi:hypothetical protein